eukprot:Seg15725.1 transcript_id=Seg15725.1/GoldUCD/mRNA.D3Y31 product="hypothetical protein" protein_id=Seg15725.1/GoldUCD/D3Y31
MAANDSGIAAASALTLGANNKSVAVVQARPSGQSAVGKTTISPEHLRLMKEQKKRMLQQQQQKNKPNHPMMILAANNSSVATTGNSSSTVSDDNNDNEEERSEEGGSTYSDDDAGSTKDACERWTALGGRCSSNRHGRASG